MRKPRQGGAGTFRRKGRSSLLLGSRTGLSGKHPNSREPRLQQFFNTHRMYRNPRANSFVSKKEPITRRSCIGFICFLEFFVLAGGGLDSPVQRARALSLN